MDAIITSQESLNYARGLDALSDAREEGDEFQSDVIYRDDGLRRYYRVDYSDVMRLGEMLSAGTRDAWSLWCAETISEELPEDYA